MRNKPIWKMKEVTVLAGLAIAVTILFCLVASAHAADMGEIFSGETRTGTIAIEGQTDAFTFYGEAGQGVVIEFADNGTDLGTALYLYRPNGRTISFKRRAVIRSSSQLPGPTIRL